jgi:asparagine synthase (glutamine-hydrolysing)
MAQALVARGPDDAGYWVDGPAGIALAHRRLEVVGLGSQGHQPMVSAGGRWVVSYNGELYNAADLRRRLGGTGTVFSGSSDTEVLVAALDRWGLAGTLDLVEGMFAFAAWDAEARRLHLVRDRFGEKPLYYGWSGGRFVFASELKAFHRLAGFAPVVDRQAVARFLALGCVPAPGCIYRGLAKLAPGCRAAVDATTAPGRLPDQEAFWSADQAISAARRRPPLGPGPAMEEEVEAALSASVAARMVADVPLGALLSGGVDSSLVVALMQRHSARPVRTFTVAFADRAFDESAAASAVARHLGTDHTTVDMGPEDVVDIVPRLPEIWDEPFADSSQLPTLLVAGVARTSVTVALSGDGGDELFAGYNRHAWLGRAWRAGAPVPWPVRRRVGAGLRRLPPSAVDRVAGALPRRFQVRLPANKLAKLARVLEAPGLEEAYGAVVAHWPDPAGLVLGSAPGEASAGSPDGPTSGLAGARGGHQITDALLRADLTTYLPDDVLTKVDRAAMAVSLETRTPFLDRAVLDVAWRLAPECRVNHGVTKWALRQVLYRLVPRPLVDRPKMGFGVPLDRWLRGPLRPWAEELLSPAALGHHQLLDPVPVRRAWADHLSARHDRGYELWDVLMLQAWMDRWSA